MLHSTLQVQGRGSSRDSESGAGWRRGGLASWCVVMFSWLVVHPTGAATFAVTLKVVDGSAKAVAQVEAAPYWQAQKGAMTAGGDKSTTTDENGKAVLQIEDWNEKRPVLLLSADRKLGGVVGVSKAEADKELTVILRPTVRLSGKLDSTELGSRPRWANTMVIADGFRAQVAQQTTTSAEFDFVLPVGKYTLRSYGTDVEDAKQTLTLAADRPEHNLGTIDLKASALAKLKGKMAPDWDVTAARGVKPAAKLADYKGKWVFLEFWGFW